MKNLIKILIIATMVQASSFSQWVQQTSGTTQGLYGILNFPSLPISIIVGTGGTILKTTNNGTNWNAVAPPVAGASLMDIKQTGVNTAWICGNAVVFKSTNAGSNWTSLSVPNRFWTSMFMLNDNTGWVCGSTDSVIKTTNAGVNWTVLENNIFPDETNGSICFTNSLVGIMCGYRSSGTGYILRTINGGTNWAAVLTAPYAVQCIQMVNSSTGYAGCLARIYKTTNSGSNWIEQQLSVPSAIFDLHFPADTETGYAVSVGGKILKTTNGGTNWYLLVSPVTDIMRCIKFNTVTPGIGYAAGNSGIIIRTTNGGGSFTGINKTAENIPENYSLSQNYPNPFNPLTNIKFSLPKSGMVTLAVYDISGREAAILVSQDLSSGSYTVDFDASQFASGTYFYKLIADGFTDVKKMILVK